MHRGPGPENRCDPRPRRRLGHRRDQSITALEGPAPRVTGVDPLSLGSPARAAVFLDAVSARLGLDDPHADSRLARSDLARYDFQVPLLPRALRAPAEQTEGADGR